MMEEKLILIIKKLKTILVTIFEMIALILLMTLTASAFLLIMVWSVLADNILDFYDYDFKRNYQYKPQSCLTRSYRLSKIGINKLKQRLSGLKSHIRLPE